MSRHNIHPATVIDTNFGVGTRPRRGLCIEFSPFTRERQSLALSMSPTRLVMIALVGTIEVKGQDQGHTGGGGAGPVIEYG